MCTYSVPRSPCSNTFAVLLLGWGITRTRGPGLNMGVCVRIPPIPSFQPNNWTSKHAGPLQNGFGFEKQNLLIPRSGCQAYATKFSVVVTRFGA